MMTYISWFTIQFLPLEKKVQFLRLVQFLTNFKG